MSEEQAAQQKRQSVPTERSIEYQLDLKTKNFRSSVTSWRRKANKLRAALIDDVGFSDVKALRDGLQVLMDTVINGQENLAELRLSSEIADDSGDKLEEVEKEHSSIMKSTLDRMIVLKEDEKSDDASLRQAVTFDEPSPVDPPSPIDPPSPVDPPVHETSPIDPLSLFAEQLRASRLPLPEPTSFDGNPLMYPGWKHAFNILIDRSGITPMDRFFYLEKYLKGQPLELVKGYALIDDETAYHDARKALEERYGNSFVIAKAFRDKMERWPRIATKDAPGLRKFSDFLRQCVTAMDKIQNLHHLNDDGEIRKILTKLPEWLVVRWSRKAYQWADSNGSFPPFKLFARFIEEESKIACCPITSVYGLRESRYERGKAVASEVRTLATDATSNRNQKEMGDRKKQWTVSCLVCKKSHSLEECPTFSAWEMTEKKKLIVEKGLCYGCLKVGHRSNECKKRSTCKDCKRRHPTALHVKDWGKVNSLNQSSNQDTTQDEVRSSSSHIARKSEGQETFKSSMIVPVWLSHKDSVGETLTYALLDTQSDTTFLLKSIKEEMGLHGTKVNLRLSTLSMKDQRINSERVYGLRVRAHDGKDKLILPPTYTRDIMPADRTHVPTPETAKSIPHLRDLSSKLIPLQDCDIGLLIGYDCARALLPRDVIPAPFNNGPYGIRTDLGWSIVGTIRSDYNRKNDDRIGISHRLMAREIPETLVIDRKEVFLSERVTTKEEITPLLVKSIMEADFTDTSVEGTAFSQNDIKFLDIMNKGIHMSDGHYEMPLPFKDERPQLPNNKAQAWSRLVHLEKKFRHNIEYQKKYTEVMETLINKGYAETAPMTDTVGATWYIPHHGVVQPNKLRVVFDGSAQYRDHSLNSHLLTGPDLTNKLTGVLCRFRLENIAFICDIQEMFHQFKVNEEDRDYLRFLWWKGGNLEEDPSAYRMTVHLFGAGSSPGCANFGLRQLATDNAAEFGEDVKNFIHGDFYVDDGLKSMSSAQEVIQLITRTKLLCEKGGLHMHKFVSNDRDVLNSVPEKDRAKNVREINIQSDELPIERALGVQWCVESDTFNFRLTLQDKPLTRRGVLSTVMSIYDPLGLIAPVVLTGKRILQELCSSSTDWDDPLPDHLRERWDRWRTDLLMLPTISINRCYKPTEFGEVKSVEYHHFADASTSGYGQCTYLRVTNAEGRVHCSLVIGKARVAPLKLVTIPRLELTAAVIAVKVKTFLDAELRLDEATHTFWTDSNVVLGYIKNSEKRFHVFVANRVQQIRRHSSASQWRHVESKENPADEGSRGLLVPQLRDSKWLHGPEFLWKETFSNESNEGEMFDIEDDDPELKKSQVHTSQTSTHSLDSSRLNRFSTWNKAKRAVANCLLFISCLRQRCHKKRTRSQSKLSKEKNINLEYLQKAEIEIVRMVQREVFPDEIQTLTAIQRGNDLTNRKKTRQMKRNSRLHQLDPFLDDRGILRIGGRIRKCDEPYEMKHPVILPRKHHMTELIIRHCHEQTAHQGRGMTLNQIRQNGFWLIGGSSRVSKYIRSCVICNRLRRPTLTQKMSDLPTDRLTPESPFTFSGMDCFGPWLIKEGRKELKRYGLLFTCMASRAVHIETLNSMNTDSFIQAYRRFVAIRGPVRQLRCDRGTNFVGAASEFQRAWKEMDHAKVQNILLNDGCDYVEFKFNVPSASHMGGAWERLIRSVRTVLDTLLHHSGRQLDDESLRTLMYEAAAIVNSRPLTTDNLSDPMYPVPLTPNHLLTMKTCIILPPPGCFQRVDLYSRRRWRRVQHLLNEFWSRWRKEFLHNLQTRQKWTAPQRNLRVGDVVVVKDNNAPRNAWPLGRIAETYPSDDKHVRKVKIAMGEQKLNAVGKRTTPCSYLERPIHKLILLVPQEDQE